jgi:DNA polymerase III delta prime subunit
MTCNYPNRVIPALHSRSQGFHIDKVDQTEFTARAAEVLITEGIDFNLDILDSYVKATYPDLRKCLNLLQMNSATGVLAPANTAEIGGSSEDYKLAAVELIKSKQYTKARELICASVRPEEMEPIFRWMYDSLDLWGDTDDQKDAAILTIRDGLVNHSFVADPEINLSATLITLLQGLK